MALNNSTIVNFDREKAGQYPDKSLTIELISAPAMKGKSSFSKLPVSHCSFKLQLVYYGVFSANFRGIHALSSC